MQPIPFIPRYKLLMEFDIRPGKQQSYIRWLMGEFIPEARDLGLHMLMAWHVAYGDYPMRQLVFVAEDLDSARRVFHSDRWRAMEDRFQAYTTNYRRKLVPYRDGYQF